ncbi:hypothetical protein Nepgr_007078 [Nepenthes gracilis]|uniref:DUF4408 domain-containing protein n=1 Tax=Nepenthes gracilis TaxID=150966 RepID=A0AAD3S669_NEPGR|nr:hypothetical protein Nepgr_007078 [Nepenthes gracilis]
MVQDQKLKLQIIRSMVFFLSVSIFSLLLSSLSGILFLHSSSYYFSTFLLPLLARTFERKYVFLLCNGIIVFLAGNFGFRPPSYSSGFDHLPVEIMKNGDAVPEPSVPDHQIIQDQVLTTHEGVARFEEETEKAINESINAGVEERETEDQFEFKDLDEEEEDEDGEFMRVGSVGGGDVGNEGVVSSSTEELNKKIEEFMRKMKEELRLEAQQQQLIAA